MDTVSESAREKEVCLWCVVEALDSLINTEEGRDGRQVRVLKPGTEDLACEFICLHVFDLLPTRGVVVGRVLGAAVGDKCRLCFMCAAVPLTRPSVKNETTCLPGTQQDCRNT